MQSTRRLLRCASSPAGWKYPGDLSFLTKSSNCVCANQGVTWAVNSAYCLTRRWKTAPIELRQLWNNLSTGDITIRQIGWGGVYAVQFYLLFVVGRSIGRGYMKGYYVGPKMTDVYGDPNAHHH